MTSGGPGFFIWGYSPGGLGDGKSRSGIQAQTGVWGTSQGQSPQNLKQFADTVYRIWLQKRSKFENFTQLISWFLTSMFHCGEGLCNILGKLAPIVHAGKATGSTY